MKRRPSAKHLVKAQERFKCSLTEFILGKGARKSSFYDFESDTPAGLLLITVYGDWIACRFDDDELGKPFSAKTGQPCNPFTGKWNHHYYDGTLASLEPAQAIASFGAKLDRLLSWASSDVEK